MSRRVVNVSGLNTYILFPDRRAAIYLARAELKPVLFEGLMANGFAPG